MDVVLMFLWWCGGVFAAVLLWWCCSGVFVVVLRWCFCGVCCFCRCFL